MAKQEIDRFLAEKQIGFAGISRQKSKFSNNVYQKLKESGYTVHPVHPEMDSFGGDACVTCIEQLPDDVQALILVASQDVCAKVLSDMSKTKINQVWIFSGKTRPDVEAEVRRLRDSGVSVISGYCPYLFLEPVSSIHSFHRLIIRLLGKYPK